MIVTEAHFEEYKAEVNRLVELLGLKDWQIQFTHTSFADCYAWINFSHADRIVVFGLATGIEERDVQAFNISKYARHEVLELLLADINTKLGNFGCKEKEISSLLHAVIRRLEKLEVK